jgi:hypothetical protein
MSFSLLTLVIWGWIESYLATTGLARNHPAIDLGGDRRQVLHSHQVLGSGREGERPTDSGDSTVTSLVQAGDHLEPPEDFLHALSPPLTEQVAEVASAASVDRAVDPLCNVRSDVLLAQCRNQLLLIVTLVGTQRDPTLARDLCRHRQSRRGSSQTMVSRVWRAFALQPHRVEGVILSKYPLFIEKPRDIVGLYLNPPDRAPVSYVDEKSQIQALYGSQSVLQMRPGQAERRVPDYLRPGTTNLFAALDFTAATVVAESDSRQRASSFASSLRPSNNGCRPGSTFI